MLNPIHAIKTLYQLEQVGISRELIEAHEKQLGIELPPLLYHYLLELGDAPFNTCYHRFVELPFERLGDYLVIGKSCDQDGVWGIHIDELTSQKQHNPMMHMSRNFDALTQTHVHWFAELPLAQFLLASAMTNGMNGGLTHHAQLYDFDGCTIPKDLLPNLEAFSTEILELRQPHERFFQTDAFGVVMLLGMDESTPNAFMIGSQNPQKFDDYLKQLAIRFTN